MTKSASFWGGIAICLLVWLVMGLMTERTHSHHDGHHGATEHAEDHGSHDGHGGGH